MTGEHRAGLQRALAKGASHDGLYAPQGGYGVSREAAMASLRRAIWIINDETDIDAGNRTEPCCEPEPVPTTAELADLLRQTVEALKAEKRLADAMTLSTASCERAVEGMESALAEARDLLEDLGEPGGK